MAPLPPINAWEEHRDLVEKSRADIYKARARRRKPGKKAMRSKSAKKLAKFTGSELHAELGRRGQKARMERFTPEERSEIVRKGAALRAIRREFCDHSKHPPKLRESGPNNGKWCCPSCYRVVPPPVKEEEGLVT